MAFTGGVRDRAATAGYLDVNLRHWEDRGYGLYSLRSADGSYVGRAGLRIAVRAGHLGVEGLAEEEIEVGYTLARAFWGCGIALAAAQAMVEQARAEHLAEGLVATAVESPGENPCQQTSAELRRQLRSAAPPGHRRCAA